MSLGKVWIGRKLSWRMPLVNWQRLQEIGFYLSTLCEFCFQFCFRYLLRCSSRFLLISYALVNWQRQWAFLYRIGNLLLLYAVHCTAYFLLLYSLYCISNLFCNILYTNTGQDFSIDTINHETSFPSQYFTSAVFLCSFLLATFLPLHFSNDWSCRHGPQFRMTIWSGIFCNFESLYLWTVTEKVGLIF
jgi:hypothetical protein